MEEHRGAFSSAMEALLHSLVVQLAVAAAIFPAIVKVFSTVEDSLSEQAKQKIGSLINRLDNANVLNAGAPKISLIFDAVFGSRQFSLACFYRVILVAVVSYVLVSLAVLTLAPQRYAHPESLMRWFIFLLFVNVPAEYFGLWMPRRLIAKQDPQYEPTVPNWLKTNRWWRERRLSEQQRKRTLLERHPQWLCLQLFLMDCGGKFALTAMLFAYVISNEEILSALNTDEMAEIIVRSVRNPAFLVPLISVFLSALWIWVYVFVRLNLRTAYKVALMLKWSLDVEKHPIRSIGVITAAVCSAIYFCVLFVTRLVVHAPDTIPGSA